MITMSWVWVQHCLEWVELSTRGRRYSTQLTGIPGSVVLMFLSVHSWVQLFSCMSFFGGGTRLWWWWLCLFITTQIFMIYSREQMNESLSTCVNPEGLWERVLSWAWPRGFGVFVDPIQGNFEKNWMVVTPRFRGCHQFFFFLEVL